MNMAAIFIRLFGRFEVSLCGQSAVDALNARRARELLGYLALHRRRPQKRETIAGLLWQDSSPEQARKYLRQALWQIQTVLHRDGEGSGRQVLEVDAEWIRLSDCEDIQVDVMCFEDAICGCHGVAGPGLDDACRARLEAAVGLYRDELLAGWYEDWCLLERERLQIDYLDALEKLVTAAEACGDSERGLTFARQVLAVDPAREQAHRHLMRLHVVAGNRTEALRAFERCERVLMQEFGVKPSRQTVLLYESIRADGLGAPVAPPVEAPRAAAREQLQALASLLENVRELLAGVQATLRDELHRPAELD
jgi:DNA-binding SARP family transcriptional activator